MSHGVSVSPKCVSGVVYSLVYVIRCVDVINMCHLVSQLSDTKITCDTLHVTQTHHISDLNTLHQLILITQTYHTTHDRDTNRQRKVH